MQTCFSMLCRRVPTPWQMKFLAMYVHVFVFYFILFVNIHINVHSKIFAGVKQKVSYLHSLWTQQTIFRSSHQRCSVKKVVLRNFTKFTGKHLRQSQIALRRGYTVKYFFQSISWNTYFTIVLLCKLPINVHDIHFEAFQKYKNSENRFSEFSVSWKTFLLNLFSFLINSFVVNDVCKNLKKNVNIKVKSKHKVVFRTLYWKNWKIDWSTFFRIMNEKDFNFDAITQLQVSSVLRSEEVWKIVSVFPFLKKQ